MSTASFFGALEKAYILFRAYDHDLWAAEEQVAANPNGLFSQAAGLTDTLKGAMGQAQGFLNAAKSIRGDVMTMAAGNKYVPFRVQYNPKSLKVSSRGGDMRIRQSNVGGSGEDAFINTKRPSETFLNVSLVIDDTNIQDAFMGDALALHPSLGGAINDIKLFARDHSVQVFTEVFAAALTRTHTSVIGFCWKNMLFWGEITSINITYSMFNKDGNPIRATVDFSLRQNQAVTDGDTPEKAYATEHMWEEAYQNLISRGSLDKTAFGFTNKAKNLINI